MLKKAVRHNAWLPFTLDLLQDFVNFSLVLLQFFMKFTLDLLQEIVIFTLVLLQCIEKVWFFHKKYISLHL